MSLTGRSFSTCSLAIIVAICDCVPRKSIKQLRRICKNCECDLKSDEALRELEKRLALEKKNSDVAD